MKCNFRTFHSIVTFLTVDYTDPLVSIFLFQEDLVCSFCWRRLWLSLEPDMYLMLKNRFLHIPKQTSFNFCSICIKFNKPKKAFHHKR